MPGSRSIGMGRGRHFLVRGTDYTRTRTRTILASVRQREDHAGVRTQPCEYHVDRAHCCFVPRRRLYGKEHRRRHCGQGKHCTDRDGDVTSASPRPVGPGGGSGVGLPSGRERFAAPSTGVESPGAGRMDNGIHWSYFPTIQPQVPIVVKTDIFLDVHNAMTAAACRRWPAFGRLVLSVDFQLRCIFLVVQNWFCQPKIYTIVSFLSSCSFSHR